ncbi:unnamed protein product [Moneuplotes crassus]|uniref:Protein kinase domain-containing protein n=1 Tax=Euplotes crassus TaxID=5936 RepID=A0AAD2D1G8_EUPCR|nr:unnamed protein product [Moneuplotes crassus]
MVIVEKDCSDLLVSILPVIRDCLSCTDTFCETMHEYYKQKDGADFSKTGAPSLKFLKQFYLKGDKSLSKSMFGAAATNAKLCKASPDIFSEFDIGNNIDEIPQEFVKEDEKTKKCEERMNETGSPQVHGDAIRLANKTVFDKGGSSMLRGTATKTGEERKEHFSSPRRILSSNHEDEKDAGEDVVTHSRIVQRESGERKLKSYYYGLRNKDLYYYKKESDEKYTGMYALKCLCERRRSRTILRRELSLKQSIGYYSITAYYDIKNTIGKGKFGRVKLVFHKKTDKKPSFKILKKKKMDSENFKLYKRKIKILKICKNPNIICLLDVFENLEYIYIVIEYLSDGPLLQYFKDRKCKLKELRVREITHQVAASLFYLKSFGIAHRDMKTDNIIMATDDDSS